MRELSLKICFSEGDGALALKWGNHSEESETVVTSEWLVTIQHKSSCTNSRFLEGKYFFINLHTLKCLCKTFSFIYRSRIKFSDALQRLFNFSTFL